MKKIILIILAVVLCAGVVGGSIVGIIKLTDSTKFDTKEISKFSYSVGGLDGSGKYMSTNASIYTKDAFECQGLECALDFDNSVSYQIYFYDQNNDFVHTTGKLTGAFVKDSVPFFAKYARIVITPNDDDVVSKLEVVKYAKQLTVKVNREQGFKNYTENLAEIEFENSRLDNNGEVIDAEGSYVIKKINVSGYKEAMIFKSSGDISAHWVSFYNADREFIGQSPIADNAIVFKSSEGVYYTSLNFTPSVLQHKGSATGDVVFICMAGNMGNPVYIYCR